MKSRGREGISKMLAYFKTLETLAIWLTVYFIWIMIKVIEAKKSQKNQKDCICKYKWKVKRQYKIVTGLWKMTRKWNVKVEWKCKKNANEKVKEGC